MIEGPHFVAPTVVKPPIMAPPVKAPPVVAAPAAEAPSRTQLTAVPQATHALMLHSACTPTSQRSIALSPTAQRSIVLPPVYLKNKSFWEAAAEFWLGLFLMGLLVLLPLWNAFALLQDDAYMFFCPKVVPVGAVAIMGCIILASFVFWFNHMALKLQRSVPLEAVFVIAIILLLMCLWKMLPLGLFYAFSHFSGAAPVAIILTCIAVLLVYTMTLLYFHRYASLQYQHIQNVMMIWAAFIMMLGLCFVLLSVPMMHEAKSAHMALFQNCDSGPKTKDLYQAWQGLQMLRQQPACSAQFSVESCAGYQPTSTARVLKYMENHFKCSGFCYQPSPTANATTVAPTLFSFGNFEASCDGSAARDMKQFAGAAAEQVFHEGLLLVGISAAIGLIKMCALFKLEGDYDTSDYADQMVKENYGTL